MTEEIWKNIKGYEGYQVSNLGRIRTYNKTSFTKKHGERHWKNRILKFKPSTSSRESIKQGMGYRVDLWKDGKPKTFLVARLVATTFLEDLINTNMTINHKDGNRLNNKVENLEWISRSDNIKYGFEHNQYSTQKSIILYNNNEEICFRSLSQACNFLKRNSNYISNCIKNHRKIFSKDGIEYFIKK